MPEISVIVPVYKVEKYIQRCVDSILNQTFSDFELILVDDGSPDNCGAICDDYAEKDHRIRVIHKENGGVSSARNAGLCVAKGEYILFCDADDSLTDDALSVMISAMENDDSQLIVSDSIHITIDYAGSTVQTKKHFDRKYTKIQLGEPKSMVTFWKSNNMLSAWAKLYRADIIRKNNVKFNPSLIVLEDYAFVIEYLLHCKSISMIPDAVYQYYVETNAQLSERRSRLDFFDDVVYVSETLSDALRQWNCDDAKEFRRISIYYTLKTAYDLLWSVKPENFAQRMRKCMRIKRAISEDLFQEMITDYRNRYSILEYVFLKRKCVTGIMFLRVIRNYI